MNYDAFAPEDRDEKIVDDRTLTVDWRDFERPTLGVVNALAAATDRNTTEIPPLQGYVDTDALDNLVDSDRPCGTASVTVTFQFDNRIVTVRSDGTVEVSG